MRWFIFFEEIQMGNADGIFQHLREKNIDINLVRIHGAHPILVLATLSKIFPVCHSETDVSNINEDIVKIQHDKWLECARVFIWNGLDMDSSGIRGVLEKINPGFLKVCEEYENEMNIKETYGENV